MMILQDISPLSPNKQVVPFEALISISLSESFNNQLIQHFLVAKMTGPGLHNKGRRAEDRYFTLDLLLYP